MYSITNYIPPMRVLHREVSFLLTLANMVLNGMQTMLSERFKVRMGKNYYNPKINLVRYADDFIVTGKDKEILENKVKPAIKEVSRKKGD